MFDVFYIGEKPGLFPHERSATSIEDARSKTRTRFCWIVSYLADYSDWNFLWEPPAWQKDYVHVWPNQWHDYSGTFLVPKAESDQYHFHADIIPNRPNRHNWSVLHAIDETQWDWSWAPHPMDPPFIYVWGNQHWPAQQMPTVEYHVPGATERKYMDWPAILSKDSTNWTIPDQVDPASVDMSWRPDPGDPPYIYEFATQWQPNGGAVYTVPGATQRKYISIQHRRLSDAAYWTIPHNVDITSVDMSWHPDNTEAPYIYEFATQWQPNGGAVYLVPGATERKYVNIQHCRLSNPDNWTIPDHVDITSVDMSWQPDNTEAPYIYEFATQWQPNGGAAYLVPGAVNRKYVGIQHRRLSNPDNWTIPDQVDPVSVDMSWHPDNTEAPYIYEFATQWQPNGGAVYTVPGATTCKYVGIQHRRLADTTPWELLKAVANFDYSWHPDNTEPAYNYVFGNQHWPGTEMPTVVYQMQGATSQKFVDTSVALLVDCKDNWELCEEIATDQWDWSWVPNPGDPPYIYVFGNQWNPPELKASVKYCVPGATEFKYMDKRTKRLPQPGLFVVNFPVSDFDYSWEPDPTEPAMTYVFGNQWNVAVLEPTVVYSTGGTETKYVDNIIAKLAPNPSAWNILDDVVDFDYSWRPDPTDPPYIYVFGNQWLPPEIRPALEYQVAGATERKYMHNLKAQRRGDSSRFEQLYPCEFDWSWEPEPGSPPYIYVFGNQYYSAEVMPTLTFTVPGATQRKYMDIPARLLPCHDNCWYKIVDCEWDYTWRPEPGSPPYIYVFGNQWWPAEKMPTMEYHMVDATERKYMDITAKLLVDMTNWHVPSHVDTTDMDFSWVPDPGEPPYIYQFATQHQKTGGPQYRVPGATEFKYVDMMRAEVQREAVPIFEIDHLDGNAGQIPDTVRKVRYFDNYRDTLIRLAKSLLGQHEHVWVCSSVCDYTDFDFTWHPEIWQSTMLHVFASDEQKFGDTFYMHVPTFAERAEKKQLLEWYSVNYVPRLRVPRRPMPVFLHQNDSHVEPVKTTDFSAPLALFTVEPTISRSTSTVSLWRQETKNITPLSRGASAVIVPKASVGYITTQLYEYAHIDKTRATLPSSPLDIVFISNGEPNAEENWQWLRSCIASAQNRLVRVDGINGRAAAYHAAANSSNTPWFFAVFAKLSVDKDFDWTWQPDRMQQPKHYIFHAINKVNGLEYGHQAMIAYNSKLTLANPGVGLDFTLDSAHEVVPINSGVAVYNTSPWSAWRTAFREVIKLRASLPDVESEYRMNQWLTGDSGDYGSWSTAGAKDALEYYDSVNGDIEELRKSYEWKWLASHALLKQGLAPDH